MRIPVHLRQHVSRGSPMTTKLGAASPFHGKAPNKSRGVWVAPWRRPDGKIGRPTGKTRVLAEASRDRHIEAAREGDRLAKLKEGFHAQSTLGELIHWWLDHIARRRVRATTFATDSKQLRLVESKLGGVLVRSLRPEQLTTFISGMVDSGSARRDVALTASG